METPSPLGLLRIQHVLAYLWGMETKKEKDKNPNTVASFSLPMRDGNQFSDITFIATIIVLAYLWGMETLLRYRVVYAGQSQF